MNFSFKLKSENQNHVTDLRGPVPKMVPMDSMEICGRSLRSTPAFAQCSPRIPGGTVDLLSGVYYNFDYR